MTREERRGRRGQGKAGEREDNSGRLHNLSICNCNGRRSSGRKS